MTTAYAPGRAELLGNHTDYNDGLVLSIAINRGTTITGTAIPDGRLSFRSTHQEKSWEGSTSSLGLVKDPSWVNYLLGVFAGLKERGILPGGVELSLDSNLPIGAGLSSSASIEGAVALLLQKLYPYEMTRLEMAKVCQWAEHHYAGVKCGLLDQISVLMSQVGHTTFIDCRSFEVRHLPVPTDARFVIVHSGVKHALTGGEYNERRASCEEAARLLGKKALRDITSGELEARAGELPELALKRARHVVGENERVAQAVSLLARGDITTFGKLMFASHESSIQNFENSCVELDFLVETAAKMEGCLGSRLSGGGFGGATINLVRADAVEAFIPAMHDAYKARYGNEAVILASEACDGGH